MYKVFSTNDITNIACNSMSVAGTVEDVWNSNSCAVNNV